MAKYPILTDEMFREMMQSDKGIREARFAVGYGRYEDGRSITDGHYVNWPNHWNQYEISDEQRAQAKERFEERKAETLEYCSQRGVLTWHSMGMNYPPTVDGGIGNYRIRTNFKDKTGHVWFIEIHPVRNDQVDADEARGWWGEVYDVSKAEEMDRGYQKKKEQLLEKYGNWWKVPTNERVYAPSCPYERIECGRPFTYANVLAWVNDRFHTDYTELFLERYFVNCDDVISEC